MDSESPILGEPFRSFQVVKTSAMGLGAPQGLAVTIHPIGGTAETPNPAYHTSKMWWTKQRPWLPASFELYSGRKVISRKTVQQQDAQIAKVRYRRWEGLIGMKCDIDIDVDARNESIKSVNEIPDKNLMRRLHVKRKGTGRVFEVRIAGTDQNATRTLNWKGNTSALGLVHDRAASCNGDLKLVCPDHPDRVLAVWKNRTDPSILGALHVLDQLDQGKAGFLDAVVVSCLAIVFAESLSARGWLGGLGKGKTANEVKPPLMQRVQNHGFQGVVALARVLL